jgi:hypothetical protein
MTSVEFATSFEGSLSFKNDKILSTKIGDNVHLRLERVGFAIARLYFVDEGNAEIEIPDGLRVIDNTHNNVLVDRLLDNQYYVLAWSDNYSIELNNATILGLSSQRQWSISGPRAAEVLSLDP